MLTSPALTCQTRHSIISRLYLMLVHSIPLAAYNKTFMMNTANFEVFNHIFSKDKNNDKKPERSIKYLTDLTRMSRIVTETGIQPSRPHPVNNLPLVRHPSPSLNFTTSASSLQPWNRRHTCPAPFPLARIFHKQKGQNPYNVLEFSGLSRI